MIPVLACSYLPRGYRFTTLRDGDRYRFELRDCAGRLATWWDTAETNRDILREEHGRAARMICEKIKAGGFDSVGAL